MPASGPGVGGGMGMRGVPVGTRMGVPSQMFHGAGAGAAVIKGGAPVDFSGVDQERMARQQQQQVFLQQLMQGSAAMPQFQLGGFSQMSGPQGFMSLLHQLLGF